MTLIERGVERGCLRNMRREKIRDPMHDARVARQPEAALAPFLLHSTCRFIVLLDHHGSGRDNRPREELEEQVIASLERANIDRERTSVIVFEPELEEVLIPVWDRVIDLLARKREELPLALAIERSDPKKSFGRALRTYRLKASPALFEEVAKELPLKKLKEGGALARLACCLVRWFGVDARGASS